ncbi:MAG: hypothetical protein AAGD96_32780, partial [Chloroflexota bacterium]
MTVKGTARLRDIERWEQLACNQDYVWGLYSRQKMEPHTVAFKKSTLQATCTCSAIKQPCKFVIALYILFAENPQAFSEADQPAWIERQFAKISKQKKQAATLKEVKAGMAEFSRWLRDQVQFGVSSFADRVPTSLEAMANQLIDAHLPFMADDLRRLGSIVAPKKGSPSENWPEILVKRLGEFYLQTLAWDRFGELSITEQQDLIHACVSPQSKFELVEPIRADKHMRWQIVGRRFETIGRSSIRRIWALDSQ